MSFPIAKAGSGFFNRSFWDSDKKDGKDPSELGALVQPGPSSSSSSSSSRAVNMPVAPSLDRSERLERSIFAAISRLLSNDAEMLKEEEIFRMSASLVKIEEVMNRLPEKFEHNGPQLKKIETFDADSESFRTDSPYLLACFLKAALRQFDFFSKDFTEEDLLYLSNQIGKNPENVIATLPSYFSGCSKCVKSFLLLLNRTAQFHSTSKMDSKSLATVIQPLLYPHFSGPAQLTTSTHLAKFLIDHADQIFPDVELDFEEIEQSESCYISSSESEAEVQRFWRSSSSFESLQASQQRRVMNSINVAIDILMANNGELLKTEDIFVASVSTQEVEDLLEKLPVHFKNKDPYTLAYFLKSVFNIKKDGNSSKRIEFLPKSFNYSHYRILTKKISKDPIGLTYELNGLFSRQNECVKNFILLLKKTSDLQAFNKMSTAKLAASINSLLYSDLHFSPEVLSKCSTDLAEFIIDNAPMIFSDQLLNMQPTFDMSSGELIIVKDLNVDKFQKWDKYNEFLMSHIHQEQLVKSKFEDEYIHPLEALNRIDRLFRFIPITQSIEKQIEDFLDLKDRVNVALIKLDQSEEDEQSDAIRKEMDQLKALLNSFQSKIQDKKELGAGLNHELNTLIEGQHCDMITALRQLKEKYGVMNKHFYQVMIDLWRMSMTIVDPSGKEMLLGQSKLMLRDWKVISNYPEKIGRFAYGPDEAIKEANLPEGTPKIDKLAMDSLDRYLYSLGISSDVKFKIYERFQQSKFSDILHPDAVSPELMKIAKDEQAPLKDRAEAYNLAYWNVGEPLAPLPKSDFNTNGFGRFHHGYTGPIKVTSVYTITLNLRIQTIFFHYMVQFQNPYNEMQLNTHYYRGIHQYELSTNQIEELPPDRFPKLSLIGELPKFPIT